MTVRIEIDLNVRVRGGQAFAGFEDIEPGTVTQDALAVGEKVIAYESESGLAGDAVVADIDPARRLIYLAVDWHSFREVPGATG